MIVILNISLLTIGTLGAPAAFGGESPETSGVGVRNNQEEDRRKSKLKSTINRLTRAKGFAIGKSGSFAICIPVVEHKPVEITLFEYDGPFRLYVYSKTNVTKTHTALVSELPKTYIFL